VKIKSKLSKLRKNTVFFLILYALAGIAKAQITSGSVIVCKNDVKTYTYTGNQSQCGVTWSVTGGVFESPDSGTSSFKQTNSNGISTIKVRWTGDYALGQISVSSACLSGSDQLDVSVSEIPLDVTVSLSSIQLGQQITLTATSVYSPTYSWTTTSFGHLNSSSGSTVTASPTAASTYTCTATEVFDYISTTITCQQKGTVSVAVLVPEITGNSVCCNQCIPNGQAASPLGQTSGITLGGGNGSTFAFQWQKSTNGVTFTNVTGGTNASINPGVLTQKTWFRRSVSGAGATPNVSNVVKIEVVDVVLSPIPATSYSQNTTKKQFGTLTIQGNQTASTGVEVDFIADTQINITPSTILSPGISLKIEPLCDPGSPGGRMATEIIKETRPAVIEEITQSHLQEKTHLNIYPNPSRSQTIIQYRVSDPGKVKLIITDHQGNTVGTVANSTNQEAGYYETTFNLQNLPAGVYFYSLETSNYREVKKVIHD